MTVHRPAFPTQVAGFEAAIAGSGFDALITEQRDRFAAAIARDGFDEAVVQPPGDGVGKGARGSAGTQPPAHAAAAPQRKTEPNE